MRKLILLPVVALAVACGDSALLEPTLEGDLEALQAAAAKPAPSLQNTIDYVFVGHLGQFDGAGRRLVWEATIDGDIEGRALWWFVPGGGPPNMPDAAHVSFYEARWEIWVDEALVLAGNSSGTTAQPKGKDGIWRGNGVVTEAYGDYAAWNGRRMFESGNVNWTFPYSGQGIFRIN
jgi:hypothetical protein